MVEKLVYEKGTDGLASCVVTFEESDANAHRIYMNLSRTVDILTIE